MTNQIEKEIMKEFDNKLISPIDFLKKLANHYTKYHYGTNKQNMPLYSYNIAKNHPHLAIYLANFNYDEFYYSDIMNWAIYDKITDLLKTKGVNNDQSYYNDIN